MTATYPAAVVVRVIEDLVRAKSPTRITRERPGLDLVAVEAIRVLSGHPSLPAMRRKIDDLRAQGDALVDLDAAGALSSRPVPAGVLPGGDRLVKAPLARIVPDPRNPREDLDDIEELAASMKAHGLIQPVAVRPVAGRLMLVAGHRRLAAARLLHWTDIPCVVKPPMTDVDALAAQLVENGQRSGLNPVAEAKALARIRSIRALSHHELGDLVGRSHMWVSNRLALLDLTPEDQDLVRRGEFGLGAATRKARAEAGKNRPESGTAWHLSATHTLASRARARCKGAHERPARKVGNTACGECWEAIIRQDERRQLLDRAATSGECPTCDAPVRDEVVPV